MKILMCNFYKYNMFTCKTTIKSKRTVTVANSNHKIWLELGSWHGRMTLMFPIDNLYVYNFDFKIPHVA